MISRDSSGSPVLPIELPNHQAAAILFSKHFMIYNACSHSGLDKAVPLVPGGEIRFISKQEPVVSLVSLPHTPQGLSPIGSNRHCVVGRDPRAPANKNEIN